MLEKELLLQGFLNSNSNARQPNPSQTNHKKYSGSEEPGYLCLCEKNYFFRDSSTATAMEAAILAITMIDSICP